MVIAGKELAALTASKGAKATVGEKRMVTVGLSSRVVIEVRKFISINQTLSVKKLNPSLNAANG
jgi:hypothetical protein